MFERTGLFSAAHDFPGPAPLKQVIAICFGPRTGSNLLAGAIWRTGSMGAPLEYFNYDSHAFSVAAAIGARNLTDYVDALVLVRTSPNGVFAAKFLPGHLMMLQNSRRQKLVGAANVVMTHRRDTAAQAVSLVIAEQSGQWRAGSAKNGEPQYDFAALLGALRYIESINAYWSQFARASGRPRVVLAYEDFAGAPDQAAARIAADFGIALDPSAILAHAPAPERQATALNAEWAARFRDEMAHKGETFAPSPFTNLRSPT